MVRGDPSRISRSEASGSLKVALSVRAKSFPEPIGTMASAGRLSEPICMRPLTTSWMMPSPPSAMTVSKPAAPLAIDSPSPGAVVSMCTYEVVTESYDSKNRLTRSAAWAPRPLWAVGFAMTSVLPRLRTAMGTSADA